MSDKKIEDKQIEAKAKEVAEQNPGLDIAAAIAAGMKMAMEQVQSGNQKAKVPPPPRSHKPCQECGQALKGCEGKHVKMIVYPQRYAEFSRFFPGVTINSKNYLSNDANHQVLVPESCVSMILKSIQEFEDNERQMIIGRKGGGRSRLSGQSGYSVTQPTQTFR